MERLKQSLPDRPAAFFFSIFCCIFSDSVLYYFSFSIAYFFRGISTVGSALHSHCRGHRFESGMLHHKRTLILIQRLAFFLCPESLAPQGFFHFTGCMEGAFPLFFGCKRRLMLVSPYSEGQLGCMIKRLLVTEPVAVLYWVHMKSNELQVQRQVSIPFFAWHEWHIEIT